ncbi:MAG TPA: hypothetical protein VMD92_19645 [Acidobacteriaceae bacterium]|jgi:hypothetical protein|nr:hypothetical protein [Acidobacteriaceae bacterium]
MISAARNTLCIALAWLMATTPALPAQETSSTPVPGPAPIPAQIAAAHAIFVSNGGGSNYFFIFSGGPDRAYNSFYRELQQSNRYTLVGSPAQADLIFEIRAIAPAVAGIHDTVSYNPQLILSIRDARTQAVLWTTSANVRAIGTQKRRDRQFDASVGVLMDRLDQVTGQTLTPAQLKAMNSNVRMPTAVKVFLIVGIAAGAALTSYGIYRVTHPPTLPPLPQPTVPAMR